MTDTLDTVRAERDALKALVIAAGFRNIDDLLARPDRLDVARDVGKAALVRWRLMRAGAKMGGAVGRVRR